MSSTRKGIRATAGKTPAGDSGLTEIVNQDQSPDQTMGTEGGSGAAGEPPQQGAHLDDGLAVINAFDDLYNQTADKAGKDSDTPPGATDGGQNNEEDPGEEDPEEGETKEEDDEFLLPESQHYAPGTAEDFTEKMRFNGLKWRHALRKRVQNDPKLRELLQWVNNRPSSMDEATRPLGQMLQEIKALRSEASQIIDTTDGYVQMPVATFERHVYPSAFLRSYLRAMGEADDLTGAVESTFLFAFHMQHQMLPAERTALDLQALRASSLHAGGEILGQVTDSSEMVSGLSLNMSNTFDKLEEECAMPNYRTVQSWSRQEAEARASTVRNTLKLYRDQALHDYQLLRATKEKNILLAQLTNSQAIENLVLNSRILKLTEEKETQVKATVGRDLRLACDKYKEAMFEITKGCMAKLETQYEEVLQHITPYDTEDARKLLAKQTELLTNLELTNTMLVSENSKLRVHMSFMPIRYRQEIEQMQKTDNQLYREQRRVHKNISPQDTDNHAGKLSCTRDDSSLHARLRVRRHQRDSSGTEEGNAVEEESLRPRHPLQIRAHPRAAASTQERSGTKARQWKGQSRSKGKPVQRGPGTLH